MASKEDLTIEIAVLEGLLGAKNQAGDAMPAGLPIVFTYRPQGSPSVYIAYGDLARITPWEVLSADSVPPRAVPMAPMTGHGWVIDDGGEWSWPPTGFTGIVEKVSDPAWRKRRGLGPVSDR